MAKATLTAPLSAEARARADLATAKANAGGATTINSLKAEVVRLTNVLNTVLDLLEQRD